jgi:hypothetical protein
MAYSRRIAANELPRGNVLTQAMAGIGMAFASRPKTTANIESTLLAASIEGMEHDDLRVLAVLTTWLEIHHPRINVDRLTRAVSAYPEPRVRCFWSAIATWLQKDRRFKRLARLYDREPPAPSNARALHHGPATGKRMKLLRVGNSFQIERRGEDERFDGSYLCVPAGVLRDRASDVLSPSKLAQQHPTYQNRVLMGPTYRSDMVAALNHEPLLTPTELARKTFGSFATAWQVKRDIDILASANTPKKRPTPIEAGR